MVKKTVIFTIILFMTTVLFSIYILKPIQAQSDYIREQIYHEEFNGKMNYFVKIEPGGRNRDNPKSMILGESYRNVPEKEMLDTARVLGLNRNSFEKSTRPVGWLDRIILSQYQ